MIFWRKTRSFTIAVAVALGFCVTAPAEAPVAAAAGLPIQSVVPARLVDTRMDGTTIDGQYTRLRSRPLPQTSLEIKIAGRGGVPADATAVMLNVTDIQSRWAYWPGHDNFLTVFPCTSEVPNASNVNTPRGDIRANNVFVKLSPAGTVCVYTYRFTEFIIDVNGYVPAGGSTQSVNPARLFDSRPGERTIDGKFAGGGRVAAGATTKIQIAGRGGVPTGARAAIINVTDVLPSGGNLLKVYPCTDKVPDASSVNTPANDIRANNVYVGLDSEGAVCVYTVRDTNVVVDVGGFVSGEGSPATLNDPVRLFDSRPGEKTVDGKYAGVGRVGPDSTTEIQIAGRGGVSGSATVAVINLTSIFPSTGNYLTAYPCDAPRPNASNVNSPSGDIRANGVVVKLSAAGTVCIYSVYATDFIVDAYGYSATPPIPFRVIGSFCENADQLLNSVEYYDDALDGKGSITPEKRYAPFVYMDFRAIGGTPPYSYEASGLKGYTLNPQTGALTRTGGLSGKVSFTLTISDSDGHKLNLPASATWAPITFLIGGYQAFLPAGETFPAVPIVNWGTRPFTYSWSGANEIKINSSTGEMTYRAKDANPVNGRITISDQTGATISVDAEITADNSWSAPVPSGKQLALGETIGQFNPSGWGSAPYSYALSGEQARYFEVNSTGQLSVISPIVLQDINRITSDPYGFGVRRVDLTVTDAVGNKLQMPVSVSIGRPPRIPFTC